MRLFPGAADFSSASTPGATAHGLVPTRPPGRRRSRRPRRRRRARRAGGCAPHSSCCCGVSGRATEDEMLAAALRRARRAAERRARGAPPAAAARGRRRCARRRARGGRRRTARRPQRRGEADQGLDAAAVGELALVSGCHAADSRRAVRAVSRTVDTEGCPPAVELRRRVFRHGRRHLHSCRIARRGRALLGGVSARKAPRSWRRWRCWWSRSCCSRRPSPTCPTPGSGSATATCAGCRLALAFEVLSFLGHIVLFRAVASGGSARASASARAPRSSSPATPRRGCSPAPARAASR